ncbi:MerR family transcriptional regulator [Anaerobacillus alkaliphilus]|uniref:MerR family transcriptional regulator n=1 Tax=Anaerobacillus alkaliphilus TaxID=1548597 RepID=A0A4Q0VWA5_9BACI|nr:MerR family transcriptional regulator [Anaerobacillus alkaliphilus]RXJ03914.1 MerR family transcriptional regulator [Anaerobacillus alkaliphilus]
MANDKAKYNIKAISNILGIQPGTLRAWERRYNIVEPIRNDSGHRLYSDEHVAILRWLLDKVNKGFTIGQAVGLLEKGSVNLETQNEPQHTNRLETFARELKESLLSFQELRANHILDEAFSLFSVEKVVLEIISPVLIEIGEAWENNKITVAHEHYSSQYLRTRIGSIFNNLQIDPLLPKVVAVCGPSERHELGLLIFTLYLRRKGFEVIYLGTGVPTKDLKLVVGETSAKYLFLSCSISTNLKETLTVIDEMSEFMPGLHIGLGGNGVYHLSKRQNEEYKQFLLGNSKDEWDEWLKVRLFKS